MGTATSGAHATAVRRFLAAGRLGLSSAVNGAKRNMGESSTPSIQALASSSPKSPKGDSSDIDDAVEAARRAFCHAGWVQMTPNERGVYLHRLADLVEKHAATLAEIESLDVGKPLAQSQGDFANFPATMRYYADLAVAARYREPIAFSKHEARLVRNPCGVCGIILPGNLPFLLVGWHLSPALAAGNTGVVKPAEDAPLSTLYLARLIKEAGIPDSVVNVVTGYGEPAGAALATLTTYSCTACHTAGFI